jgi:hypothetical protein
LAIPVCNAGRSLAAGEEKTHVSRLWVLGYTIAAVDIAKHSNIRNQFVSTGVWGSAAGGRIYVFHSLEHLPKLYRLGSTALIVPLQ